MPKKIAILAKDKQCEALRISAGLIMMDDIIDVFVLDRRVSEEPDTQKNLSMCKEMGLNIYTNSKDNADLEYLSTEALADKLLEYDIIDAI